MLGVMTAVTTMAACPPGGRLRLQTHFLGDCPQEHEHQVPWRILGIGCQMVPSVASASATRITGEDKGSEWWGVRVLQWPTKS